jgi:diguanylate cyclase (GGDEF)-like protein
MNSARRQPPASNTQPADAAQALVGALSQSAQIEARVEECAEEISSITAVLKEEMTPRQPSRDAEQALAQSEQVKQKIEQCAEELHSLNAALSKEMRERRKSERALAGMQVRLIGAQIDVLEARSELTRVKDERERARYFAFHDSLTGLSNRNLFSDRLEHALACAKRHRNILAVMCIDVDKFKSINEAHSHYVGDKVLQMAAQRLHASVRAADTVCRKEGDQFLLLLEELADPRTAEPIAKKMIHTISQPLDIEGLHLIVTASIGVAVYPHDGETAETLINNAEGAVSDAKCDTGRYAFFNPRYN